MLFSQGHTAVYPKEFIFLHQGTILNISWEFIAHELD